MFNFLRVRRARSIVEQVGVELVDAMSALAPADRAATLAICNAMMMVAAQRWGKAVMNAPETLPQKSAVEIVFYLAAMHGEIVNGYLEPMRHRGMNDVTFAQGVRQARAAELVISTVGLALVPDSRPRIIPAWKTLWNARPEAEHAVALLLQYSSHSKSSPFPVIKGMKMDKQKALQLASSVPPFLRPKQGAGNRPPARKSTTAR